jgi:histidinol-phosphate aminotransferase
MSAAKYIRANVAAMDGYVPGEQPRDSAVVKLNTNENPYPPSPSVAEALRRIDVGGLRRYPDPMATALRDAIAGLHGCRREQVFAGNGSDEVLALCLRAFVENDGGAGYFEPSYSLYPVLADIQGIEKRPVSLDSDFGWDMPADYRAALFFLTNPNAPTSMLFERETVADFCRAFDGVVVIDEAYVDFAARDCMDLALASENVLVARTLSKAYSLAGIRLGYLVGDESLIAALYKIKDSYNINAVTQALAHAAIEDQAHMRANRDRIVATRERSARQLAQLGFRVCPSQSNFLWVRPADIPAAELFAELKRRSIYIRHFQQESICDWLRISIGTDAEMERLISELAGSGNC